MRAWQFGLLAPLMMGCPDRSIDKIGPVQSGVSIKKIPVSADIDILFVIDNSASTADKQMLFLQNFPRFVQALDAFPTGRPSLHLGVVDTTVDIGVSGFEKQHCPSPDPHDNGLLQNTPRIQGCTPPSGPFIADIKNPDGSRTTNYAAGDTLEHTLSCIAQLGATGCGFEAPLEAMKRALDGSRAENTGFIRNGAYLAVIFLTDEDDASVADSRVFTLTLPNVDKLGDFLVQPLFAYQCTPAISATQPGTYTHCTPRTDSYLRDPHSYSQFLTGIKPGGQVIVAAIAAPPPGLQTNDDPPQTASSPDIMTGPPPPSLVGDPQELALLPSCTATVNGNPAIGRPAVRLASFLSDFGDRGRFYTVCQSDYSAALADIGKTIFQSITPCLEGPIDPRDADPSNPGLQLQCSVSDTRIDDQTGASETVMPSCQMADATTPAAGGARPCWWVSRDTTACPTTDTGFELQVERAQPPATGTTVEVQCALVDRM